MNAVNKVSRSTTIVHRLEELILDGTLKPGDKLPSERQLSERLTASRPLIREAIKELRGRGVIETQHGRGSFVTGMLDQVEAHSSLTRLYHSHPRLLFDLLEVRERLEGQAAQLAAERATDKDLYLITKAFDAMNEEENEERDLLQAAQLDHAFHRSIYEASHNPVLIHTLQNLMQLMLNSVVVSVSNLYHRDRPKQQIDAYHRLIFNAIIDRKPDNAYRAAVEHIRDVRDGIREIEQEEQRLIRAELWNRDTAMQGRS